MKRSLRPFKDVLSFIAEATEIRSVLTLCLKAEKNTEVKIDCEINRTGDINYAYRAPLQFYFSLILTTFYM